MDRTHRRQRVRQAMESVREPRQAKIHHEEPAPPELRPRAGALRKPPEMERQNPRPRDIREQRETRGQHPRRHHQRSRFRQLLPEPPRCPGTAGHRMHRPVHQRPERTKEGTEEKAPRKNQDDEVGTILGGPAPRCRRALFSGNGAALRSPRLSENVALLKGTVQNNRSQVYAPRGRPRPDRESLPRYGRLSAIISFYFANINIT